MNPIYYLNADFAEKFYYHWRIILQTFMCLGNLSELFLAFIIIILIIIRIRTLNNIKSFNIILNFGIIGLIAELLVVMSTMSDTMPKFNLISAMVYTPISLYIKILICLFTIFIFFMMKDYFRYEKFFNPELPILMLMCIDGMFITLSSNDLMMTYLGLELQSLSIFTMAALQKHSNLSIEASVKYFFYGSCASGILLFGISLVYGSFGSINYSIIAKFFLIFATINTEIPLSVIYGMIFILAGLLFKLGIAPFHFWVSDIYEGTAGIIAFFFAVIPKISLFYVLHVIIGVVFFTHSQYIIIYPYKDVVIYLLSLCAILSMIMGVLGAMYQVTIYRFIAYSSIANMGYVLLSLFCTSSNFGIFAAMNYLLIYLLSLIQFFSVIISLRFLRNSSKIRNIVELSSLFNSNPWLSWILVFPILTWAGIPPFAGFSSKALIVWSLIASQKYVLSLCVVIVSVISCAYYIRLIRLLLFWNKEFAYKNVREFIPLTEKQAFFIAFITIINLCLIFFQLEIIGQFEHCLLGGIR